jgi:hypothetical protein
MQRNMSCSLKTKQFRVIPWSLGASKIITLQYEQLEQQ